MQKNFTLELSKKEISYITGGSNQNNTASFNKEKSENIVGYYVNMGILTASIIIVETGLFFLYSNIKQLSNFGIGAPPASVTYAMLAAVPVFVNNANFPCAATP